MKKTFTLVLLALFCICGYAQTIDPVLLNEMGQHRDNEKMKVFVIMRQQYDQQQLNRLAARFTTRAERREFVVNELKQFAEASQYDLRHSLAEMQRNDLVSEPNVLWIANAIFFDATREAILSLADRSDIMVIGLDEERNWLPDGEESTPTQLTREITSNVTQVNADQVWNLGYTGQGVVVAVIDTGVNYNHLDLADHLWDGGTEFPYHGYDVYNNDNNPMDDHGHGTHCAGTVCGDGTAGSQTGIAPDATLMCVKCLNSNGGCNDSHVISSMQWAVEHGCDVISMSLGGHGHSGAEKTILRNTCVNVLNAGVIASIAAGNEGDKLSSYPIPNNVGLPGGCPPPYMDPVQENNPGGLSCVFCVGAVDYNDEAAYFTSRGPVTWSDTEFGDYPYTAGSSTNFGLIRPDVCAPGVNVISANYLGNSSYTTKSGTSMATPCVAGCMALMLSKNNDATPAEICKVLEETAMPLATGKSNIYGYGRVDVLSAINAMYSGPLTLEDFTVNDNQDNNDGKLNAGESVTLDLTLTNDSDISVDGVTMVLTTESEYVTITNGTATLPHFDAGQIQTIENVFAFTLDDNAPGNRVIRFAVETFVGRESVGIIWINIMVYGHVLRFDGVTILNDNNGNGMLEAGETADMQVIISNVGNESATSIDGTLSTAFPYIVFNDGTTKTFGNIEVGGQSFADFNVTLAGSSPVEYIIDFSLDLVDDSEKHSNLDFKLYGGIIDFADANVKSICVYNWDTNGDGELSYAEAAAVTDLGYTFSSNEIIVSFDELQYFTGLSSIGNFAFVECSSLVSIVLPNSVSSIGEGAFDGCGGLSGSLTIPNPVTFIGDYAFYGCNALNAIYYSGDLHQWNNIQFISYSSNPLYYAHNLYIDNELVSDLVIPETVTVIKPYTFIGATCLTSLTIPNSVTSIGSYAFYNCDGLTSLTISNSVTSIGSYAFGLCGGIFSITSFAETPPTVSGNAFVSLNSNTVVYVPCGFEDNYASLSWGGFNNFYGMCGGIVTVAANPEEGGIVTGGGTFEAGQTCTVTATTMEGYDFAYWTLNDVMISNSAEYTFYVAGDMTLEAHFMLEGNIVFADDDVKSICVSNWDTNNDGELSYAEAASILYLGTCFSGSGITSFDELQYFTNVFSIGYAAFSSCRRLSSVSLPNSVTSICDDAFYRCSSLSSITIGNSVISIGNYVFYDCNGLSSVTIGNSVTSIGNHAFNGCRGLSSITIGNSVISIGNYAFFNCSGLSSVTIGNSVTSIGNHAFNGCRGLSSITIGSSVTSIGVRAFYMCNGLTSVTFGNSVASIGDHAFFDCSRLNAVYYTGDIHQWCNIQFGNEYSNPLYYAHNLFIDNELVTDLVIPETLTEIKPYVFCGATCLTSLIIPNSIISIGNSAFYYCSGLTTLTIGNSVNSMGNYAFCQCFALNAVYYNGNIQQWCNIQFSDYNSNPISFAHNLFIDNELVTDLVIPETVTEIKSYAFCNASRLSSLTIGNSVTSIGVRAFYMCNGLYIITSLAETPPTLGVGGDYGYEVFDQRISNVPVYVPCGAEDAYASGSWGGFSNFHGMCGGTVTVVADPEEGGTVTGGGTFEAGQAFTLTATAAEGYSFANWTLNGLIVSYNTEYTFYVAGDMTLVAHFVPEGNIVFADANVKALCVSNWDTDGDGELSYIEAALVTSLGEVFRNNTDIVSFEELQYFIGLRSIDDRAFVNCVGLASIELPNYVTSIGDYAFFGCSGLTALTIGSSVTSIGESAFGGCSGLNAVYYTGDIHQWCNILFRGSNPLYYAHNLFIDDELVTDLVIPETVTEIKPYAFIGATCLTSLTISNSVTSIGRNAFTGCSSLTGLLTLPNSITLIDYQAFQNCSGLNGVYYMGDIHQWCNIQFGGIGSNPLCFVHNLFIDNELVTDLVIPETVTEIKQYAFDGATCLTSLTISDSVTSIGRSAFQNCSGLTTLTIGNSVTLIDEYAFQNCSGLNAVYYTGDIHQWCNIQFDGFYGYSNPLYYAHNLFIDDELVTDLVIPEIVTEIKQYAFYGASCLTSVTIPSSVTSIGSAAFQYCTGLNAVYYTGDIHQWCNIQFSSYSNPLVYAHNLFIDNELVTDLVIPETVTEIKPYAFMGATCLTSLTISSSVTLIGGSAFSNCNGILSITSLAETPPVVYYQTFNSLSPNISVFVPCGFEDAYASVTDPWDDFKNSSWGGFNNFYGLCGGTVTAVADPTEGGTVTGGGTFEAGQTCTVTATAAEGYAFDKWILNGSPISNNAEYTFYVASDMTLVAHFVPDGNIVFADANVKAICVTNWDTNGDGELSYVEAAMVTSLGEVFRGNTEITSFEELQYFIGLTSIGDNAFSGCSGLTILTIGNSVTSIGNSAFQYCSGLNAVYYTGDIQQWCNIQFSNSYSNPLYYAHNLFIDDVLITDLVLPETVTEIKQFAFYRATCLTSLTIPNSVTTIGRYAFDGCSGLTGSLTIPNSITSIGDGVFENCSGLTFLTIPNSVTSIGNFAFWYCRGLTSLTIGNSVTSIGDYVFYGCRNLTSITIHAETPPVTYSSTFNYCPKSIPVYVPCGSMEAYQSAAGWNQFTNIQESCSQQIVTLSEGWNWFSTYIEVTNPIEMLQTLEAALGDNGLQIKNDNISTEYDSEWGWFGDLDEVGFTNEEMIMIKTAADCTLELQGTPTNPAIHPITINPGWNWIGYPCAEEMTLEEAFSNFTPEVNDKVKNSEGTSEYDAEWGWFGDVETLVPGQGFMYYSASTVPKTLVFQAGRK